MRAAPDTSRRIAAVGLVLAASTIAEMPPAAAANAQAQRRPIPAEADPRLREMTYDPHGVVTVPVKRGVVTVVLLDVDESIAELAAGLGSDCSKPDSAWCIAAQPGGRTVFVKPKSTADAANNLAIVTSRRIHNLRLQVLADNDPRAPLYRLAIKAPSPAVRTQQAAPQPSPLAALFEAHLQTLAPADMPPQPSAAQLVSERLQAQPAVRNTQYSLAEGDDSQDIVPTLVYDDGRFTYLRLPGNREMPAVFQVLGDGSEALVNARMEDDLLVVDRVSRRLMLRAGSAVVGIWNEAFDIEGLPRDQGTTVPGLRRALRGSQPAQHSSLHRPAATERVPRDEPRIDGGAR